MLHSSFRLLTLVLALTTALLGGVSQAQDTPTSPQLIARSEPVSAPVVGTPSSPAPVEVQSARPLDQRGVYQRTLAGTAWIHASKGEGRTTDGTGWLVDAQRRLLITNHHVVDGVQGKLQVYFAVHEDGRLMTDPLQYDRHVEAHEGTLIDSDPELDLALVQLDSLPSGAREFELVSQSVTPGERVHSVAGKSKGSQALWVYTTGVVRQVYRKRVRFPGQTIDATVVEAQCPVNQGNSGGPIVNDLGQLVAVVSFSSKVADVVQSFIDISEVRGYLEIVRPLVDPLVAENFNLRGRRHHKAGRHETAIADFTAAIQADPKLSLALANRGWARMEIDLLDEALADFDQALNLDAESSYASWGRGVVLREQGELDRSQADLTQAIQRDGESEDLFEIINDRGLTHFQAGSFEKALADFTQAIQERDNIDLTPQALADVVRNIELNEEKAQLRSNRADSLHALQRYEDALKDLEQARELDSDNGFYYAQTGKTLMAQEEYRKAERFYNAAMKLDEEEPKYLAGRGLAQRALGRTNDAFKSFLAAADLDPENGEYFNEAGICLYQAGEFARAVAAFELAIKRNQNNEMYYANRGDSMSRLGRNDEALKDLNKAIELNPQRGYCFRIRGDIFASLGETQKAFNDFRNAVQLDPTGNKHFFRRRVKVVNNTGQQIKVRMLYLSQDNAGSWNWFPNAPGGNQAYIWTFEPGEEAYLMMEGTHIAANRVRIWAEATDSRDKWESDKEEDLWIVPRQGYMTGGQMGTFTYTIK